MSRFFEFRLPIWPQIIRSIVVFLSTSAEHQYRTKANRLTFSATHTRILGLGKDNVFPRFQYHAMNVVGNDFSVRTPRLPAGLAIYLTRFLIHAGKSRRCVCVCVRALQQLDLSVGPRNYLLHKPFTRATG